MDTSCFARRYHQSCDALKSEWCLICNIPETVGCGISNDCPLTIRILYVGLCGCWSIYMLGFQKMCFDRMICVLQQNVCNIVHADIVWSQIIAASGMAFCHCRIFLSWLFGKSLGMAKRLSGHRLYELWMTIMWLNHAVNSLAMNVCDCCCYKKNWSHCKWESYVRMKVSMNCVVQCNQI